MSIMENNTIYIVFQTDYFDDTTDIYGVFSSKEKAISSLKADYEDIEETIWENYWWRPIETDSRLKFKIKEYVVH